MVTDDSYTCGKHSIMYREAESLCCTLETYNIVCHLYSNKNFKINYIKKQNIIVIIYYIIIFGSSINNIYVLITNYIH